jgi:hypothetical protein
MSKICNTPPQMSYATWFSNVTSWLTPCSHQMASPTSARPLCSGECNVRQSLQKCNFSRMKSNDTSPRTSQPLEHKMLMPNMMARQMIAAWCEQNGVPVPVPSVHRPGSEHAAAGGGATAFLLQKPVVTCELHSKEPVRVFCRDCNRGVCVLCAVDVDICKTHNTKPFEPLLDELKTDREGWARAQRECDEGAQRLCALIQADGDTKKRLYNQEIDKQVAAMLQEVRSAAAARSAALSAIVHKRREREEAVIAASAVSEVAVKDSAAAKCVASAFNRTKGPIASGSAAEFRAAPHPAAAVGKLVMADAVVDPENENAALVAAQDDILGSALLGHVAHRNTLLQFVALLKIRLPGKRFRLLYTWSKDGRSNASFHQRCDNQVGAFEILFACRAHTPMLPIRDPPWSL